MKQRLHYLLLLILTLLSVAPPHPLWARPAIQGTVPTVVGEPNAIGVRLATTNGTSVQPRLRSQSLLTREDYRRIYTQAKTLLDTGTAFRLNNLQLPPSCKTLEECKLNYQNVNSGLLYNGFCSNYDRIDANGYCPGDTPTIWPQPTTNIRGQLARARTLYGFLALAEPADTTIDVGGRMTPIRQLGMSGVLTATRELANIHLIFGNEFMVDAIDYRFGGNDPRADQIIAEELSQLRLAHQQFELAFDALTHAFNSDLGGVTPTYIGDFFTERDYKLFGILSERMVSAIGEMAERYRQLNQESAALTLYSRAFANQYVQAMALAQSAQARGQDFMRNGGWEMLQQMEKLRARALVIQSDVNPFGFVDSYVPLQTYSEMRELTQREFLRDATEDENRAESAQRDFDQNRTALNSELQNLRLTYDNRLLDICGASTDYARRCDGGLMQQNKSNLENAANRIYLVDVRMNNLVKQVEIEQQRANEVIQLTLENGDQIAANALAKGLVNVHRTSYAVATSVSTQATWGLRWTGTQAVGIRLPPIEVSWRLEEYVDMSFSHSFVGSVNYVYDPEQIELAKLEGEQAIQQAINQAQITGANSAATIRTLLLQQAELVVEKKIAFTEWNRLADEHNHLVQQYHNWLNLRTQAQNDLIDSYLTNPAYRIYRDQSTLEAGRSIDIAAQFAYLSAKALEYEFLTPFPKLADIFKARTADDVDNFLNDLEAYRVAVGSPGQRNRYPYQISLARHLLGLTDESIDPGNSLSAAQKAGERMKRFQSFLNDHLVRDAGGNVVAVEIPFTTSLLDNRIFSPNIWNNRIAGVALPVDVPGTQGLSLNLLTRQFGEIGTPEVQVTHSGKASYRTATGAIVHYLPENARLAGYVTPPGFPSHEATATILASVNGNGRGAPTSAFFNRSVAASRWMLRIDLRSPFNSKLDLSQLEDVELNMDTTGVALVGGPPAPTAPVSRTLPPPSTQPITPTTGSYWGTVDVQNPAPMGVLDLALDLRESNGALTGKINRVRSQGFDSAAPLSGQVTVTVGITPTFSLVSTWFTGTVAGRAVERQLRLQGVVVDSHDTLKGHYTETIRGFTPQPLVVSGQFYLTRPRGSTRPPDTPVDPTDPTDPGNPAPKNSRLYLPLVSKNAVANSQATVAAAPPDLPVVAETASLSTTPALSLTAVVSITATVTPTAALTATTAVSSTAMSFPLVAPTDLVTPTAVPATEAGQQSYLPLVSQ